MQLDRISGIGETVFLGHEVLKATLTGFVKGLKAKSGELSCNLKNNFLEFISGFSPDQIFSIMIRIVYARRTDPQERAIIRKGLESHCKLVCALFKTGSESDFY